MRKFKLSSLFLIFCCLFWYSTCFADGLGNVGADNTRFNYKIGTVPARANAAAPTWTEANSVPLSVDLSGNLRTTGTVTVNARVSTSSFAFLNMTTATTTQIVGISGSTQVKIYGFYTSNSSATVNQTWKFVTGTGVNCATGQSDLTGQFNTPGNFGQYNISMGNMPIVIAPAGQAVCVTTTGAAATFSVNVTYVQE